MNTVSHDQIIGIDVSRDRLNVHGLPDGKRDIEYDAIASGNNPRPARLRVAGMKL